MGLVCSECGGKNIQVKAWVDANDNSYQYEANAETQDKWCGDCEDHLPFVSQTEYDDAHQED